MKLNIIKDYNASIKEEIKIENKEKYLDATLEDVDNDEMKAKLEKFSKGKSSHRNLLFVINNYTSNEVKNILNSIEMGRFIYICFEYEVGKEGTPHIQGYAEFQSAISFSAAHKIKGFERAHFIPRSEFSNKLFAASYCAKEFTYKICERILKEEAAEGNFDYVAPSEKEALDWSRFNVDLWRSEINKPYQDLYIEAGDWKHGQKRGTRTDITIIKEIVNKGGNMNDILNVATSYQAAKMGQMLLTYQAPTRNWKSDVYWISGPTGTGKSYTANKIAVGSVWYSSDTLHWFDGYSGQTTVIIDDFRLDQLKSVSWFLRLTDKYPLNVPIKGGFTNWCPKVIIITSPYKPQEVFDMNNEIIDKAFGGDASDSNAQGLRRITQHIHLTERYIDVNNDTPTDKDIIKARLNVSELSKHIQVHPFTKQKYINYIKQDENKIEIKVAHTALPTSHKGKGNSDKMPFPCDLIKPATPEPTALPMNKYGNNLTMPDLTKSCILRNKIDRF